MRHGSAKRIQLTSRSPRPRRRRRCRALELAREMTERERRHLVIWEASHDNGWTTLVMEQPDGTFVAWAGPDETVGVDYVEDCPEHAQAEAMFRAETKVGARSVLVALFRFRAADAHDVSNAHAVITRVEKGFPRRVTEPR